MLTKEINMLVKCSALLLLISFAASANIYAGCDIVDGAKRTPFDGKDIKGLQIEKKSLILLNDEFPSLNIIEKTFTGEAQTCTNCTEKHISCSK